MFSRAPLEIILIRLTKRRYVLSLPKIMEKLEVMEKKGQGSGDAFSAGMKETGANLSFGKTSPQPTDGAERKFQAKSTPKKDSIEDPDDEQEGVDFNTEKFQWKAILGYVKDKKMSMYMLLNVGKPVEFSSDKIVIGFKKEHTFHKETLEVGENRKILEEAVNKIIGSSPRVELTFPEFWGGNAEEAVDTRKPEKETDETVKEIKPCIEKAMDIFGGHIVRDFPEAEK
jgi:hypothetical protein